jgi:hypothetical protein
MATTGLNTLLAACSSVPALGITDITDPAITAVLTTAITVIGTTAVRTTGAIMVGDMATAAGITVMDIVAASTVIVNRRQRAEKVGAFAPTLFFAS